MGDNRSRIIGNDAKKALRSFEDDFLSLHELVDQIILKVVTDTSHPNGVIERSDDVFSLESGKQIRRVCPRGYSSLRNYLQKAESKRCLYFSHFSARKLPKERICLDLEQQVVQAEHLMCTSEIQRYKDIAAFLICQEHNKEDVQMVTIARTPQALDAWCTNTFYAHTMKELAPWYYEKVRIHMGRLEQGLRSNVFTVLRTTFLDYSDFAQTHQSHRVVRQWAAEGVDNTVTLSL